ncbi:hypothetical protein OOK36_49670 [Streptomyces sp. NBC_00365]|uniref:hypothetical protein n=1 Tax=Streptomyces sp. NBC_00365 TaxID=2975726 RepID=UPI00225656FC|nr:hypothetical protein [Streptomyces sp. NBC_00365]MCX5096650.1 hypothetical protein [Streptomyces sp. NBC_00365]
MSTSRYPLLYVPDSWAVRSMLQLTAPVIEHRTRRRDGGGRTVWMAHPDGSWARAGTDGPLQSPTVHQGGPRRLWSTLEEIRDQRVVIPPCDHRLQLPMIQGGSIARR